MCSVFIQSKKWDNHKKKKTQSEYDILQCFGHFDLCVKGRKLLALFSDQDMEGENLRQMWNIL